MNGARISVAELQEIGRELVPLVGALGLQVESVTPGESVVRIPYRDEFVRPGGSLAGPVMMAAADFAMFGAVLSLIGRVELALTTNLNINFLRRPPLGDVVAHARIIKLGSRLAFGEILVHASDGEDPVAHVTSTYSIPPRSRDGG